MILAGASIRACQATGRHILAFEDDLEIFKVLLEPLIPTSIPAPLIQKKTIRRQAPNERAEEK